MSVSVHVSDSCRLIWSSTFVSTFHDDDDDDDGNSWPVGSFGRCLGQHRKSYSHWRKMMLKWSADLEWWELFGAINAMASDSTVYYRPISSKIIREKPKPAVDRGDFAALVLLDLYLLRSTRHSAAEIADKLRHSRCCPQVHGSSRTWPAVPSMSHVVRPDRPLFSWYVVFHGAQCLGQFCSSCIQLTWFHSSSSTACRRTSTLMTFRFMVQWSICCGCPAAEDYRMSDSCCRLDVGQSAPIEFR